MSIDGGTYRSLLGLPHPLLIDQENGVPGLLHVQVAATHLAPMSFESGFVRGVTGSRMSSSPPTASNLPYRREMYEGEANQSQTSRVDRD